MTEAVKDLEYEMHKARALRVPHYVCASTSAAGGIFHLEPGQKEPARIHPPKRTVFDGDKQRLLADYGASIENILDAAKSALITWEQACAASEHVDLYALPFHVTDGLGYELELASLVAWEFVTVEPNEPPSLNLLIMGAPYVSLHPDGSGPRQAMYNRMREMQVLVAQVSRISVTRGEVTSAIDEFARAVVELESD